jgi:oxygen-dependent protoporphyrinogen oxidase
LTPTASERDGAGGAGEPRTAAAAGQGQRAGAAPVDVLVVGGGLAGLATGFWASRLDPSARVVVLEAAARAGGKASTVEVDGFAVDTGPGTLSLEPEATAPLLEALGLAGEALDPATDVGRRYLVRNGRLVPVPSGPGGFLASPLLPWPAKARALLEPTRPPATGDETVHDFLARRFGPGVARVFGEALVSGVAAGDPRDLSVAALFPQLKALEARAGSLIRGMAAARRAGAPPRRTVALRGGMRRLHEALVYALGARLVTGAEAASLRTRGGVYEVASLDGRTWTARSVVLATPAYVTARLLEDTAPEAARLLGEVPYAPVDVVALGYRREDVPPLAGFGFVAPRGQGVRSLGVIYASAIAPGLAPEGHVLLRAIAGGALDPGFADLEAGDKVEAVRADVRAALGVTAEPVVAHVASWPRGIPQYRLGHLERLAAAEADLARLPGVRLAGDAYRGLGVVDRLREGLRVARELTAGRAAAPTGASPPG